jgi:hypothetical protein
MDKKYQGNDIPRFTKSEMKTKVEEFADFHVTSNLTLKDLMSNTKSLSFLPLEEANHECWAYGRFVCLGDAIHKMTPNVGGWFLLCSQLLTDISLAKVGTRLSKVLPYLQTALLKC